MAKKVERQWIGIDVSKAELSVAVHGRTEVLTLTNTPAACAKWLATLPAHSVIAVEATNTYHLEVLMQAYRLGLTCYVVDGYRLNRYREGVGGRAKTDRSDALLLARYLAHEHTALRPWSPPAGGSRTVQRLLHRRATLVRAHTALAQSLEALPELKAQAEALFAQIKVMDKALCKAMHRALRASGWGEDLARCQAVEGIGPLSATALVATFHRVPFRSSDAFIAFIGLDVRVRDSGTSRGQRKLTKHGDSELRRLLYNAAMAASRSDTWAPFYQRCHARGLSTTQALVILARKLARIAFSLMKNQSDYHPRTPLGACNAT